MSSTIATAARGSTAALGDERTQVGAVDEAHRDEELAVGRAGAEDRDDVGVVDGSGVSRLGFEAPLELRVAGEPWRDDLERDRPVEALVAGEIDDAHTALAEAPDDAEVAEPVAGTQSARFGSHRSCLAQGETSRG